LATATLKAELRRSGRYAGALKRLGYSRCHWTSKFELGYSRCHWTSKFDVFGDKLSTLQSYIMEQVSARAAGAEPFIAQTALCHQVAHQLRDIAVQYMPKLDGFYPRDLSSEEPHPILEHVKGDIISVLEKYCPCFRAGHWLRYKNMGVYT